MRNYIFSSLMWLMIIGLVGMFYTYYSGNEENSSNSNITSNQKDLLNQGIDNESAELTIVDKHEIKVQAEQFKTRIQNETVILESEYQESIPVEHSIQVKTNINEITEIENQWEQRFAQAEKKEHYTSMVYENDYE